MCKYVGLGGYVSVCMYIYAYVYVYAYDYVYIHQYMYVYVTVDVFTYILFSDTCMCFNKTVTMKKANYLMMISQLTNHIRIDFNMDRVTCSNM